MPMGVYRRATLADRLEARTVKSDGCWVATGSTDKDGYVRFFYRLGNSRDGVPLRCVRAHRLAWELANGMPVPSGMDVCHTCDNPPCVRSDHLFLGTNADNVADRDAKGRSASGERNGSRLHPDRLICGERQWKARLTAAEVIVIRQAGCTGLETQREIAARFAVSQITVSRVVRRLSWKHVT